MCLLGVYGSVPFGLLGAAALVLLRPKPDTGPR